jgi:hypothetical protein
MALATAADDAKTWSFLLGRLASPSIGAGARTERLGE